MSTAPEVAKVAAKAKKIAPAMAPEKAVRPAKPAKVAKAPTKRAAVRPARKKDAAAPAGTRPTHDPSRLAQVLVAPIVSEKATLVAEKHNQYLFKVLRAASKPEIKAAVELMFKVEVESVQTVQHKGKSKRFGKASGRRDHVKKAYVSLAKGQELNLSGEGA